MTGRVTAEYIGGTLERLRTEDPLCAATDAHASARALVAGWER